MDKVWSGGHYCQFTGTVPKTLTQIMPHITPNGSDNWKQGIFP